MTNLLHFGINLVLFAFCFLPALPLTLSWIDIVRRKVMFDRITVLFLALVSLSFALILLALFSPLALGPPHSRARQLIIGFNALLMLLVAVGSFIRSRDITSEVLAASATALVWCYIAAINVSV